MVYVLPGESYKEVDLHQIHDQALKDADVALLEDAWEVSSHAFQQHSFPVRSNFETLMLLPLSQHEHCPTTR